MAKCRIRSIAMKKKLLNILFWSVISAAFIGPGTITTASLAGASHGPTLLWALLFSTLACIVLQEGAARISTASGLTIGEAVSIVFGSKPWVKWLLGGSVIFGCAAYEAGNIVGAISGLGLILPLPQWVFTTVISAAVFFILWSGSASGVAKALGTLVAVMGVAFIYTSLFAPYEAGNILKGLVLPALPEGSLLLVIGLIGTTIVPYNLFLGSGLGKGQTTGEMRLGLVIAIGLGGLVSMAVLLSGTLSSTPFSLQGMGEVLKVSVGPAGNLMFAIGLFAAGFTSSVTAPLASAITAQSLWGERGQEGHTSRLYRAVWLTVLLMGFLFGMLNLRPVPVILAAQAVNGILLPVAATGLLLVLNREEIMGLQKNGVLSNLTSLLIVGVTVFLGLHQLSRAFFSAMGLGIPDDALYFAAVLLLSLLPLGILAFRIFKQ